mgnify:CR=1 FL=1|tara:strand:+ start:11879 stop:14461 length:2583 start_codon:yes stop_codon:yes gene_type:complete
MIPTVNIVVSYDRDVITELVATGSVKSFIEKHTDSDETIVFSNRSSSNFLSLKHTTTSKGGVDSIGLELEFLDVEGVFTDSLKRVIEDPFAPSTGLIKQLLGSKNLDLELAKLDEGKSQWLTKAKKSIKDDLTRLNALSNPTQSTANDVLGLDVEHGTQLTLYSQNKALLDKLLKEQIPKTHRSVYITYGTEDLMSYWSPVMCFDKVLKVEFSFNTNGAKVIKFKYDGVGVHSNLTEDNVFSRKLYGKEVQISGYSNKIFNEAHTKVLSGRLGVDFDSAFSTFKPNLHEVITTTLRNFCNAAVDNGNSVVLLPDLDKLMSPQVTESLRREQGTFVSLSPQQRMSAYTRVLRANGLTVTKTTPSNFSRKFASNPKLQELQFERQTDLNSFKSKDFIKEYIEALVVKASVTADGIGEGRQFLPVLTDTLTTIQDKINANLPDGSKKVDFTYRVETDFGVLKMLYEHDIITDPSLPALIVGDRDTISRVIDGNVSEEPNGGGGLSNPMSIIDTKGSYADLMTDALAVRVYGYISSLHSLNGVPGTKLQTRSPIFTFGKRNPNVLNIDLDINLQMTSMVNGISFVSDTDTLVTSVLGEEPKRQDEFEKKIKKLVADNQGNTVVPPEFITLVKPFYIDATIGDDAESQAIADLLLEVAVAGFAEDTNPDAGVLDSLEGYVDDISNVATAATNVYHGGFPGRFNHNGFLDYLEDSDIDDAVFYNDDDEGQMRGRTEAFRFLWEKMVDAYTVTGKTEVTLDENQTPLDGIVKASNDIRDKYLSATFKTLPMFWLSSIPRAINRKVYVDGVEPSFAQSITGESEFVEKNSWISGVYNIFGFTHIVSASEVTSEFNIAKAVVNSEGTGI